MSQQESETPLFTKTADFLDWLVQVSNHFPRLHRHTITRRLLNAALDFQESILEANVKRSRARLAAQEEADAHLDKVRNYLRLALRLQWLSLGQYDHASHAVAELGRLLGAWIKRTRKEVS